MAKSHKPEGAEEKKHLHVKDRLTYAYIRKIKKWMFCPACQHGKMTINKASTMWTCEECGYKLSANEFEDNYVFWFCDECNAYLNNQDGINRHAAKHICQNCGYENDTALENIKGICSDCGKIIPDPDATLCADCRLIRKQKAKEWLITAGKVVGVVVAVVGTAYLASQSTDNDDNSNYTPLQDGDDEKGESDVDTWHNNVDGISETDYCQGCIHHYVYPIDEKTHEVCNIWGRDGCYSGCDRKETTPRFRWTDANRWDKD